MSTLLLALLLGCSGAESTAPQAEAPKPATAPPAAPAAAPETPAPAALPEGANPALLNPSLAEGVSPDTWKAQFETTQGTFVVDVTRAWAPLASDRFYNLVKIGFYDDVAFFRVVDGFMVQFGISGYPEVNKAWRGARMPDDPVTQKNTRGMVTFATSGKDSRTTQVFINFEDKNTFLDEMGFAPFGQVTTGMDVVDKLYKGYGEGAPKGMGPHQGKLQSLGNPYLKKEFPQLDYVKKATIGG
jgi:peptidyl-prolyl cis-trans isomerase A (cyclophilin A)